MQQRPQIIGLITPDMTDEDEEKLVDKIMDWLAKQPPKSTAAPVRHDHGKPTGK